MSLQESLPEIPQKLKDAKRKVGECDFQCPNCGRQLHRVLWEQAGSWEYDEVKKKWSIEWGSGPVTNYAICSCGAELLVAETDYEGTVELFHVRQNGELLKE